ncbi:MAG: type II toxin-antitoxin system VapB family antitoxin [Nitrospirota bacterium]
MARSTLQRKNFYLDEEKIQRAKRILGTKTETETVTRALDLVIFRKEILASLEKVRGKGGVRARAYSWRRPPGGAALGVSTSAVRKASRNKST